MKADIAVFAYSEQPYRAVIEGGPASVSLVVVNGQALYGLEDLATPLALAPDTCERVSPCGGEARALCFKGSAPAFTRTVAELEELLSGQLAAVTMPAGYEYAGTLHSLWECRPEERRSCDPRAPSDGDTDGDAIPDDSDNCPLAWDPTQVDADGDSQGDACDLCPLDPVSDDCAPPSADDFDADGVPNDDDNCAEVANLDQADRDSDGKGDACDACPDAPNPGAAGCPVEVQAIRDPSHPEHPAELSVVRVSGLVVTAVGPSGFHAQDPAAATFGGVYVFTSSAPTVAEGDVVDVDGTYEEYFGLSELTGPTVTRTATGSPIPAPIVVDPCAVGTGGASAEAYESMLVRVEGVDVTSANPDAGAGDYGEMEVESCLRVDDGYYAGFSRVVGTRYSSIQGPLFYSFSHTKLRPRRAGDLSVP
ncbi:MAG: thrombospondin type 3 repeat-containing protein [Deltaproteobacteria bacterium]|nr:thrombospondin type 3 repeat-containing protein [Deltaproteobacteria bacterium]